MIPLTGPAARMLLAAITTSVTPAVSRTISIGLCIATAVVLQASAELPWTGLPIPFLLALLRLIILLETTSGHVGMRTGSSWFRVQRGYGRV